MKAIINGRRGSVSRRKQSAKTPGTWRPILVMLFLLISIAALLLARSSFVQVTSADLQPTRLSDAALQQIQALDSEKESRSPAQRKIDSQLIYATKMHRGESIAPGVDKLDVNVGADAAGMVTVDISADIDDALLASLKSMGIEYSSVFPRYHALRASASLDQLEAIASLSQVRFIQPQQLFTTNQASGSLERGAAGSSSLTFQSNAQRIEKLRHALAAEGIGAQTNVLPNGFDGVGSANAEAVISHGVYSARGTFNTNGLGIRIGVLSNGVVTMAASQATGDLPPTCSSLTPPATEQCVNVVPGQTGSGDEGTAMMEVIHDIAPAAQLYFATANPTITQFATNILALRNVYSCDIIVDDVGYFAESAFQDGQGPLVISTTNGGVVTQAVNDVVASGALYFSSAANSGNLNDATAGTWEGDFADGGTIALISGTNHVHDFDPTAAVAQSDLLTVGTGTAPVSLAWSDPLGGSNNDYDLYILNSTLTTVITSSTNIQTGTQDPFEQTSVTVAANRRAVILQKAGAAGRFLHLDTNRGVLQVATSGNTHGHNAASGGYGVAASPVFMPFGFPVGPTFFNGPFPNLYTTADKTETFSSDGPRRSFFQGDGTPFTAGNFSSTGGSVFQQPLIAASDGNSVTGVGGFGSPFFGTSCAAPTAAAIAGLIKAANPALTPAQIKTALTSTALDIEAAGIDRDTGNGLVMPYPAMQSLALTGKAFLEFNGATATETCCNGNGLIEPGEGGTLTVNLKNTGLANATGITTTLSTSTNHVIVLQNGSAYSNITSGGSTGNNTTLFRFSMGTATPVDQVINFTLTINYAGGWAPSQAINFTVQSGRQPITTTLDATAPPTSTSFPVTATGAQTGRLNLSGTGTQSTCGTLKTNPGASATGSRNFDSYTLTNPTAATVCVTATLMEDKTENDFLFHVGYAGSFVPATPSTNYLADWGTSNRIIPMSMSFNVAGGQTIVIVVPGNTAALTGTPYTLQISGLPLSALAPTAAPANISGRVVGTDGAPLPGVTVRLSGAESGTTISDADGNYSFGNVPTGDFYTVSPSLANYHFSPANRSFSLVADKTDAVFTAAPDAVPTANAIDTNEYFVRQQYLDFLGREPEAGGFNFWLGQLNQCNADAACTRTKRIDVSAAFFNSQEFRDTGSFVYDLYAGTLGRTPTFAEFGPDRSQVVGGANVEQARAAFADSFINRAEFTAKYPQTLSREQFVDALLQTMQVRSGAEVTSLRNTLLSAYDSGGRVATVRAGIEAASFVQAENNKSFVLMEYFGYLRRNPDPAGYDFWLNVLTNNEPGNYRGMVCSFLTSAEYQHRFGATVTHTNSECAGQ
jgi:Carboxypeptidase regulatory-like domain/Subtilase family/Domain of unknown function (DUF4214)